MKRPLPLFFVLLLTVFALLVPLGHGDVIFLSQLTATNNVTFCSTGPVQCYAGECFTMPGTSYFLTSATFAMKRTGAAAASMTIIAQIETASGTPRNCIGTGNAGAIATSTNTLADILTSSMAFYTFTFTSVPLAAGQLYELAVRMICTSGCGVQTYQMAATDIGSPAGMNANINVNEGGWTCVDGCPATRDAAFTLTGIAQGGAQTVTQCLGTCGSILNTNSTHTTNFNASVTLFYSVQTNVNGFVLNASTVIAKSYVNGMTVYLGVYVVDRTCTATANPFTPQCPGALIRSQSFTNPAKGALAVQTNIAVLTGQWIGIALSASFSGLDVNDTNTPGTLLRAAGIMPSFISQYVSLGSSNMALKGFINGNASSSTSNPLAGCTTGDIPCTLSNFVTALGGNLLGGLAAFGLLFGFTAGFMLYVGRERDPQTRVVTGNMFGWEMFLFVGVIFMLIFYAAGIFPIWVPVLIMVVFAWLISETLWSRRKSSGSV